MPAIDSDWLGASELGAAMGLSPYMTAWDVWARKTGRLPPDDSQPSIPFVLGDCLEQAALRLAPQILGEPAEPGPGRLYHKFDTLPSGGVCADLDGVLPTSNRVLEVKTDGIASGRAHLDWGDPGTDQVPPMYYVQTQIYMHLADKPGCVVIAFLGGKGIATYEIARREEYARHFLEYAEQFWRDYILADKPPPDSSPSERVVARVRLDERDYLPSIPIDANAYDLAIGDYIQACSARRIAEHNAKAAQARIMALLGGLGAAILECEDGRRASVRFKTYEVSRVSSRNAATVLPPELYKKIVTVSKARRLTISADEPVPCDDADGDSDA